MWFYMSFADNTRPKGKKWLGAVIIDGSDITDAIRHSWQIGTNPGGEVVFLECEHLPPEEYRRRLLNKQDLRAMGTAMGDPTLTDLDGREI